MNSSLHEDSSEPSHSLQESVLIGIKKKHPLFHPQFSADDWVENNGIFSLSEAAVTLAVAEYRTQIEIHNSNLDSQIVLWKNEIATLEQQLTGLSAWDKPRRWEITAALGKLKTEHKATSSDTVKAEIDTKSAALELELTTMTNDREQRNKINSRIDEIVLHWKRLNEKRISSEQQTSLTEDLQSTLNDVYIKIPKKPTAHISAPSRIPFLSTTSGKVVTILVGLGIGTSIAWWNIVDQISKWKKPVNAIERLLNWDEKKSNTINTSELHAAVSYVIQNASFPKEINSNVFDTNNGDEESKLLRIFGDNMRAIMPSSVFELQVIKNMDIWRQSYDWDKWETTVYIKVGTTLFWDIETTRTAKIASSKR